MHNHNATAEIALKHKRFSCAKTSQHKRVVRRCRFVLFAGRMLAVYEVYRVLTTRGERTAGRE